MADVPRWWAKGDWFDVCNCKVPCPCTWAEAPTEPYCEGVLAWRIREGRYGEVPLDDLRLLVVGRFEGSLWGGDGVGKSAIFLDGRADESQQEALWMIFGGEAGGWPGTYAHLLQIEGVGYELATIDFEVAGDLTFWRAEIPGKVTARGEALTGPAVPPGALVQVVNAPGGDTGPGQVSTWGRVATNRVDAFGFAWEVTGTSSKHIPFDWSGPDA
jgi:hypothetical protein